MSVEEGAPDAPQVSEREVLGRATTQPEPEPEPQPEPQPEPTLSEVDEGTICRVLRGKGAYCLAPPSAAKCRSALQAAQLRLILCFLHNQRLTAHCPLLLEAGRVPEAIAACFLVLGPDSDEFWEEEGRATGCEAAKVAAIRAACTQPEKDRDGLVKLNLWGKGLGAAGGAVLGAALAAMPAPLPFEVMDLRRNELTDAAMVLVAAAIGGGRAPRLRAVDVCHNPAVGDEGTTALGHALGPRGWIREANQDARGGRAPGDVMGIVDQPEWSTNTFWEECTTGHGAHRPPPTTSSPAPGTRLSSVYYCLKS